MCLLVAFNIAAVVAGAVVGVQVVIAFFKEGAHLGLLVEVERVAIVIVGAEGCTLLHTGDLLVQDCAPTRVLAIVVVVTALLEKGARCSSLSEQGNNSHKKDGNKLGGDHGCGVLQ